MKLNSGERLGIYEVLAPIGAGGMGEVYRARDMRLEREVAIKVLPDAFAADADRLARFEREARLLASLNHPNIAVIHGFERAGDTPFLVLELVNGPTLADTLRRGAVELREALAIAAQVAEAVEAAHEKNIVHRDLKPANIKITPEGKVKVLDFGLAKAFGDEMSALGGVSQSPTMTAAATRAGVILGTAAYMSPEQARGKPVDKRTDIWAFGCVLYEMLAGRQVFHSETVSDAIAGILAREPDWQALPPSVPERMRELLRRCLEKDPHKRLRDIGDARIEIEAALSGASTVTALRAVPEPKRGFQPSTALWLAAGLLAGALAMWLMRPAAPVPAKAHLSITLPATQSLTVGENPALAVSPDGTRIVYTATSTGTQKLFLRHLDQFEAKPIAGSEGAMSPFFSPDGQWIAFFTAGQLKKVAASGGPAVTICDVQDGNSGDWGPDDTIYFARSWIGAISKVPAAGGKPEPVTKVETVKGEASHRWPELLPGGDAMLFSAGKATTFEDASLEVITLKDGKRRKLIESASSVRYVSTGHLLYARGSVLLAVPFDVKRLAVTGPPIPVLEGVMTDPSLGSAQLSVSSTGLLAYISGTAEVPKRSLVWLDGKGAGQSIAPEGRAYEDLALSPDGKRLALTVEGPSWNVWTLELARGILTRVTFENDNRDPAWSPDGKRVVYSSFRNGRYGLFAKPVDGSGPEERLTSSDLWQSPDAWSPDGKTLVFNQHDPVTNSDIWVLPMEPGLPQAERKPRAFANTNFIENFAAFSPDGHWLAYSSNESGREEVYVQAFPGQGAKWQVSTEGGTRPVWLSNGREMFYRNGEKIMAVDVETKPAFRSGTPRVRFEGKYRPAGRDYDVSPDGKRVVIIRDHEQKSPTTEIRVVQNWLEDLKRKK